MNEDVGASSTKQTHSELLIAVTASQRAEAKGKKNNQNRPSVWVLKKTAGGEITWKGLQSSPSNFSVSHLHSLSPANPVKCASPIHRLQQNRDWLLCAVLSDGSFKKRGLPQPSRHPFGPALLCQAHRMRLQTDGRTDGRRRAGGDGMKHTKDFLADHYLTHRQEESNQHSSQFLLFPTTPAFYHSKCYLQQIQRYQKELRTRGEIHTWNQIGFSRHIMHQNSWIYIYSMHICWLFMTQVFNTVASVRFSKHMRSNLSTNSQKSCRKMQIHAIYMFHTAKYSTRPQT